LTLTILLSQGEIVIFKHPWGAPTWLWYDIKFYNRTKGVWSKFQECR